MTREEARQHHDTFVRDARRRTSRLVPDHWEEPVRVEEQPDCWLFVHADGPPRAGHRYQAVVVRKDGTGTHALLGAIGESFRAAPAELGLPRTSERWLGSGPGRYQAFDRGLLVWHEDPGLAYSRHVPAETTAGRRCLALVAFFDLRGFSRWARRQDPHDVQALMARMEAIVQDAFNQRWCRLLFVKGIGDGLMVVSERDWFTSDRRPHGGQRSPPPYRAGHLSAFLRACGAVIVEVQTATSRELAIGCGIDLGEVTQVFLFGQADYLGEAVNTAARLQQLAWDEIIVSTGFAERLAASDEPCRDIPRRSVALADRGIRVDPSTCATPGSWPAAWEDEPDRLR